MIDFLASRPHYWRHLEPIWHALADRRGDRYGHGTPTRTPIGSGPPVLVAGASDIALIPRGRPVALLEHGAGQSYIGLDHPSYTGGQGRYRVGLYLVPRHEVGDANLARYPDAQAAVVGCPALDAHHDRPTPTGRPVVAIAFHWAADLGIPELRPALGHYLPQLANVADQLRQLGCDPVGHGHPRWRRAAATFAHCGIRYEPDWDTLLATASVVVVDNSSVGFEAAAVGVPVVWLDAPWYRRDVEHGLRFWSHAGVGERVDGPDQVVEAVARALGGQTAAQADLAAAVYERLDGRCAERAAAALVAWAERATPRL